MDRHSARRASSFRFTQLRPTQAPPLSDEAVRLLAERLTSQGAAIQRGRFPPATRTWASSSPMI